MKKLSPEEKLAIIKEAEEGKSSIFSICLRHNISKVSFYKWLEIYKRGKRNRLAALRSRVRSGSFHPRALAVRQKLAVLRIVHKQPQMSAKKIAKAVGIGQHGVQNILADAGLNRYSARLEFSRKPFWKREEAGRRMAMIELKEQGWQTKDICRHFGVSKVTFGKWQRRYQENPQEQSLEDRYISGQNHHKALSPQTESKVVEFVRSNPEESVHNIHRQLATEIGHHGIQNVLVRYDLNTREKRLAFAQGYAPQPKVAVAPAYIPELPLYKLRFLLSPFKTVPKLVFKNPKAGIPLSLLTSLPILLLVFWVKVLIGTPNQSPVGLFFASIALSFGFFFFIYSMKYYISALLVLKLASGGTGGGIGEAKQVLPTPTQNLLGRILGKLGRLSERQTRINPLLFNLEKVEVRERPFVSIHVACYNEKKVVERLLRACTAQEWYTADGKQQTAVSGKQSANYEVVIADDSTDETTEIAKDLLLSMGYSVARTQYEPPSPMAAEGQGEEMEVFLFTPGPVSGKGKEVSDQLPTVKLIHRFSRQGFKGGALQKALENTDPRAEYICVFDADFVPYPDTIEQFVKTFQVLNADSLQQTADSQAVSGQQSAVSNIAAVQGYQWHVLNKSQNWITRGVRTEYAGSYVIERSSAEIYGGLKQIAGSVYCIRADILRQFGWGTSITEDFELTLRLYEAGYKVAFTPYIQAPAEAVSTIKRLIRQRMRWAEGASFNVKVMLPRMFKSSRLTRAEKLEFAYLAPYYLQAAFFVVGTFSWFLSEAVLGSRMPFWTAAFGWSLVFTNLLSLPLMNIIGLFLEESDQRDYVGIISFVFLSYIVVPFQAYAALKGFLETSEGPWFRTPKTGAITDTIDRFGFGRFFGKFIGGQGAAAINHEVRGMNYGKEMHKVAFSFAPAAVVRSGRRRIPYLGKVLIVVLLVSAMTINYFALKTPIAFAFGADKTFDINGTTTINATKTGGVSGTSGDATLTVSSTTGFSAGDMVLIIQMITGGGGTAGDFEERQISTVDSSTQVTLTANKTNAYASSSGGKAQMIKAEVNNAVTVTGSDTVTASSWNGTVGGVLYYIANTFTVNSSGIVDMNGKGFGGGAMVPLVESSGTGADCTSTREANGGSGGAGTSGSSGSGSGAGNGGGSGGLGGGGTGTQVSTTAAGGGGAGSGGGGAGGSFGAAASNGTAGATGGAGGATGAGSGGSAGSAGTAGSTYGQADFTDATGALFMGSGGGSGGSGGGAGGGGCYDDSTEGFVSTGGAGGDGIASGAGGAGGGIVVVKAVTITNNGTIRAGGAGGGNSDTSANRNEGGNGTASASCDAGGCAGGGGGSGGSGGAGGGGSGGSVWLSGSSGMTIGTTQATGNSGGTTNNAGPGGTGKITGGGTCGEGGGGGKNGTSSSSADCTDGTSGGSTTGNGSSGGDGRIKCDNSAGDCTGGSPSVGSTEVATAPVPENLLFALPLVPFLPRIVERIRRIKVFGKIRMVMAQLI